MLEFLANMDRALFFFINVHLANPVTDVLMPVVTSDDLLRVLYGAALVILLWRGNDRLRWLVLFSAMAVAATDQLSSGLFKAAIARPRPCHVLDGIHMLVDCGGGFSMPSSHAANAFGQAALFAYHARNALWYLVGFATLVALSRVFVGVHYPADILAGGVLGATVGLAIAWIFSRFLEWRLSRAD